MSQFNKILRANGLPKHNGKPLWKYNLTDTEFWSLRKSILETKSLTGTDPRDYTLYYAEWWKRSFDGGSPSKSEIFNSIKNGQYYNSEDFYKHAKRGASLLGIQWIKNQNTLYFRTMLLQGGLPIKHMARNKGSYKNFLLKILELNPATIDDFSFDSRFTSLLPSSCRNDEIYECCFNIVKAIIKDDHDYLKILDSSPELNEITSELRVKKKTLDLQRRKSKPRTAWVYEPQKKKIRLYLGLTDLTNEDFASLFLPAQEGSPESSEYKLYCNHLLICKFIRKTNSDYKLIWINKNDLDWDGMAGSNNLLLIDEFGNQTPVADLLPRSPDLTKPTLWVQYSEHQFLFEKGAHTSQEQGFILCPNHYNFDHAFQCQTMTVSDRELFWIPFEDEIVLSGATGQRKFKTKSEKFDWHIRDESPAWMQKASMPVVTQSPKILVYDRDGNLQINYKVKWRQNTAHIWNSFGHNLPTGLIELQLTAGTIVEYDQVFNIGKLDLTTDSNSLNGATLTLHRNDFRFSISENDLVSVERIDDGTLRIGQKDVEKLPVALQASLLSHQNSKNLRFEVVPPFKGVEIIANDGTLVSNGSIFQFQKLSGYRLISNEENVFIKLYNTKNKSLTITERVSSNVTPLRNFEDRIIQLFTLSDSMDSEANIELEIFFQNGEELKKINEFEIHRYTKAIQWKLDDSNQVAIFFDDPEADLFAVPLDCSNSQLEMIALINVADRYLFPEGTSHQRFIVFAGKEYVNSVQPVLVIRNLGCESIAFESTMDRILKFKSELLDNSQDSDIWQRLLSYYKICINNELPFSTFDILRALTISSELCAKGFLFFAAFDESGSFAPTQIQRMENELGFSFHWASRTHWEKAMEWLGCFADHQLLSAINNVLQEHFGSLNGIHFRKIYTYITGAKPQILVGYHLNTRINDLRAKLGPRVLNELPKHCPTIPDPYKSVILVTKEYSNVKILLKSPVSVALSIAGKDDHLWNDQNEEIRRNVRYSQAIDSEWYSEAISYCLNKI